MYNTPTTGFVTCIKTLALLCLLLACLQPLRAQAPFIEWSKCYGSFGGDYIDAIKVTSDGGFIVIGDIETNGGDVKGFHGNPQIGDIWVVKLNSAGEIQWQKCLGGDYFDKGGDILQTQDGGYIAVGTSASLNCGAEDNHGGTDVALFKLSPDGDVEWQKRLGGSKNEYGTSIDMAADGGYFIAGSAMSADKDLTTNNGDFDYWVLKVDSRGNIIWQNSGGGSRTDQAYSIKATPDGGAIAAGRELSTDGDFTKNHNSEDAWVARYDKNGVLQWRKNYGGSGFDGATAIQCTPDGGYAMAGYASRPDGDVASIHGLAGSGDFWLVKLNNDGSIAWEKTYGGDKNDRAYNMQLTADGGYILCGSAESGNGDLNCNSGSTDVWVVKADAFGNIQWNKTMGGISYDEALFIKPINNTEYIIGAYTCSADIRGHHEYAGSDLSCGDFWVVKLSAPIAITPGLQVTINPSSANICAGTTNTITATVQNVAESYAIYWQRNGATITIDASYTAPDFKEGDVISCSIATGSKCSPGTGASSTSTVILKNKKTKVTPAIGLTADNTVLCGCIKVMAKAAVTDAGPGAAYTWLVNNRVVDNNKATYTVNALKPGDKMQCIYTDTLACIAGDSVRSNIIVFTGGTSAAPGVNISPSVAGTICPGMKVKFTAKAFNAGIDPYYDWTVNGVTVATSRDTLVTETLKDGDVIQCAIIIDSTFKCATENNAKSNIIIANVSGTVMPSVQINTPSTSICSGAQVTFTATPVNAGTGAAYQWLINGNAIPGAGNNVFTSSTLKDGDIVNCNIAVDESYTCAISKQATSNPVTIAVINKQLPTVNITASAQAVCAGSPVSFTASAPNAGASPSYQWLVNNIQVGNNTSTYTTTTLQKNDNVACMLAVADAACPGANVQSNVLRIMVNDTPIITLSPADTIVSAGAAIKLTAGVQGSVSSFTWQPGNKLVDNTALSPVTTPLNEDALFKLVVVNNAGCYAAKTALVKVYSLFLMPTAFTPNGDGKNDVFRIPPHTPIVLGSFAIYNRWGQLVFYTQDASRGWDGNIKGNPAPGGVYVYIVQAKDNTGKDVSVKGSVVLLR